VFGWRKTTRDIRWHDDFSPEIRWLANHLLPIKASWKIVGPLASSQACKLGLPLKVGTNMSTRLDLANQLDTLHTLLLLECCSSPSSTTTSTWTPNKSPPKSTTQSPCWFQLCHNHQVVYEVATCKSNKHHWLATQPPSTTQCNLLMHHTRITQPLSK
jgi:hypothetical protein